MSHFVSCRLICQYLVSMKVETYFYIPVSLMLSNSVQVLSYILKDFFEPATKCVTTLYYGYLLYTNIDLKLRNKLHRTMHYKLGVTCVYNDHVFILCCNNTTI